jgi:hypothetical protein
MKATKYMTVGNFFSLCFLLSLSLGNFMLEASNKYDIVNELEHTFAKEMKQTLGLHLSGSSHSMHENIEKLGLKFVIHRRATLEEARAIHLFAMERFVQTVNNFEKILPYLAIHPFSPKRAEITINFEGINGRHSDGSITFMFNVSDLSKAPARNHIVYFAHDPCDDSHIKQHQEPYEEAVRHNKASSTDPLVHQGNGYEEEMDHLLFSFGGEIERDYQLSVWHLGGKWTNEVENVGATIKLHHFSTQEEARQLLVEVVEKLLLAINSNEKVRPFLKMYPFPAHLLRIKFHFESTNQHPLPDIRLKNMALEDGMITYEQVTVLPLEEGEVFRDKEYLTLPLESYAEAQQIVENKPIKLELPSSSIFGKIMNWFVGVLFIIIMPFTGV